MNHLRKWLLCVIAAVSLTVTACGGDAAANASVAADVAHAAGNILGSLAEAAENSGAGNSGGQGNKTSSGMTGNPSATEGIRLSDDIPNIRTPLCGGQWKCSRILRRTTLTDVSL